MYSFIENSTTYIINLHSYDGVTSYDSYVLNIKSKTNQNKKTAENGYM